MGLLQPAVNTSAFLKAGIMGKQGSGKSKTGAKILIGLIQHLKKLGIPYADKPVAMFDTEGGSDFLIPDFEAVGIPFVVAKKKSFADLIEVIKEAEAGAAGLHIDSITHPYREMVAAYLKKKQRTFLQIDDWQYLKGDNGWTQFTNLFTNSNLHIVMCGRAGDDLEQYTDQDGKRQLEKVGTKMKTEAETGFEPSLLIEMRLIEVNEREGGKRERSFVNRATVVKDRWDQINGQEFDYPTFEHFLPHISRLALGGTHVGIESTNDSQHILKTEKRDWQPVQRKIAISEIHDLMTLMFPGQTAQDKTGKIKTLMKHFDACWQEIEDVMPLDRLRAGYDSLHREHHGTPSKYAVEVAKQKAGEKVDLNDSLPDHSQGTAAEPKPQTSNDAGPIPDSLDRQKHSELTLKEKLLLDIPNLKTVTDCFSWGQTVAKMEQLTTQERLAISSALLAQQTKIVNEAQAAAKAEKTEPAASETTEATEAKPGKGKTKKALETA